MTFKRNLTMFSCLTTFGLVNYWYLYPKQFCENQKWGRGLIKSQYDKLYFSDTPPPPPL